MKPRALRFVTFFVILTLLLTLAPTGSQTLSAHNVLQPDSAPAASAVNFDFQPASASTGDDMRTLIDLRDHGPDPMTVIALVGQPVVWTNNGTKSHTITEGDPSIFRTYLPIVLAQSGTAGTQAADPIPRVAPLDDTPIFDSGPIVPGDQFTYTFTTTGTFTYHSKPSVGRVVGNVVAVQASATALEPVEAGVAATISTTTGASLEIEAGAALTDTVASISEVDSLMLGGSTGTPVGSMFALDVDHFHTVVSGSVTVTLPYDPSRLPVGSSEDQVRAYHLNGNRWISVAGSVDTAQNKVVLSTSHLSNWMVQSPCQNPFGLTAEQEIAFDKAADYFNSLTTSRDLFDVFVTSDGQRLFGLDFDTAGWLASHSLCDLASINPGEIPLAKTPNEIVAEMVDFGSTLLEIGDDFGHASEDQEALERLSHAMIFLEVLGWTGGPISGLVTSVLTRIVVETLVFSVLRIALTVEYAGELAVVQQELDTWLTTADPSGDSALPAFAANQLAAGSTCNTYGLQATGSLYYYQVPGRRIIGGYEWSDAYGSLYDEEGDTYFVLGLQNLYPFREGPFEDFTDYIHLLIEYKDTQDNTRATTIRYANLGSTILGGVGVCVMGRVKLPQIKRGSEVKVRYIFVEGGKLDRRFAAEGFYSALPAQGRLYYRPTVCPEVGEVVHTIQVPTGGVQGIAWDGSHLWAVWGYSIYRLHPETGDIVKQLPSPAPDPQDITWDGSTLWVVSYNTNYIYQIDADTGDVLRSFASPTDKAFGLAWDGQHLWHTTTYDLLYRLNPSNGQVLETISDLYDGRLIDWDGQYLWEHGDRIRCLDLDQRTVVLRLDSPTTFGKGVAWDGEYLWCAGFEDSNIYQVNISSCGAP